MTYEEASAIVLGASGFGWLQVHYDHDSASWVSTSDQGSSDALVASDLWSAQTEALATLGKTAASAWVYSGNDEDGAKLVVV